MKVYVTRHGQTEWNVEDRVLGRTDLVLTQTGEEQAKALARSLEGEPIDLVITSPLTRTVQTGEYIARALRVPAVTADALIEMDFGVFEGVQRRDPVYQEEKKRYFARLQGGESFMDLAGRVYPFLKSLPETVPRILAAQAAGGDAGPYPAGEQSMPARADGGKGAAPGGPQSSYTADAGKTGAAPDGSAPNVLLVTHNGICRVIASYFRDLSNDEFRNFQLDNCHVMRFEL